MQFLAFGRTPAARGAQSKVVTFWRGRSPDNWPNPLSYFSGVLPVVVAEKLTGKLEPPY